MYADRGEAGRRLAESLSELEGNENAIVLGLPRGGVTVAFQVARELDVDMDLFLVRKLGAPPNPELAMGALASGGIRILNDDVIQAYGISGETVARVTSKENDELRRRETLYRGDRPFPDLAGRIVILVDDGIATGASMQAAVRALESKEPARLVVAVPTGPADVCEFFRSEGIETICLSTPKPFRGVSGSYRDFAQVSDEEVQNIMEEYFELEKERKRQP